MWVAQEKRSRFESHRCGCINSWFSEATQLVSLAQGHDLPALRASVYRPTVLSIRLMKQHDSVIRLSSFCTIKLNFIFSFLNKGWVLEVCSEVQNLNWSFRLRIGRFLPFLELVGYLGLQNLSRHILFQRLLFPSLSRTTSVLFANGFVIQ